MEELSLALNRIIESATSKLNKISQEEWNYSSAPGKWTNKEILGHLTDSAANNHQRFVRVQFEQNPAITYNQNKWVETQDYKNASSENLVNLWISYNKHLAHIISGIPKDKINNTCDISREKPVTLEWLVNDYIRHLKHHLAQITGEE